MVTMSFDKNPVSYDGHSPSECARALHDAGVDIVGVNCLRNPMLLLPIAAEMRKAVTGFVACQPTAYRTPPEIPDFTAMKEFPYETETLVLSRRAMAPTRPRRRPWGSTTSDPAVAPSRSMCERWRGPWGRRRRTVPGGWTTANPCRLTSSITIRLPDRNHITQGTESTCSST